MAYLKWEDYVVLVITLALSLGIGLLQSRKGTQQNTTSQYIMGNGKMAVLPVALSLMVSYQSGIMMLGVPAEVYLYGMQIYMAFLGNFIGDLISVHVFVPRLSKLQITSIFEYLEVRFDSRFIRLFGTALSIFFGINYLGTVLAMPAVTLKAVAGIDVWTSIIFLMVVVLIYTLIGGFTAVIWTDVLQSLLMHGGIFAVLIKGTMDAGGLRNTWQTVYEQGRLNFFVFDLDPTIRQSFWSLAVGGFITYLRNPFLQTSYLRIKATPLVKTSKRMYLIAGLLTLVTNILAGMCGVITFAYYFNKGCDPLLSNQQDNANQLLPALVLDIFQGIPCLPGLFMAALFCASLSTLSSILNGITSVFWEDIVKPHTKPMSERRGIIITQLSGLAFGIIGIGIAFVISEIEGPVIQIFLTTGACFSGAVTGIFILGFIVPWADKWGAIVGGVTSVLLVAWITLGKTMSSRTRHNPTLSSAPIDNCPSLDISSSNFSLYDSNGTFSSFFNTETTLGPKTAIDEPYGIDVLYSLSFRWLEPLGTITVLLVGSLVSRFTGMNTVESSVSQEVTVSLSDVACCCTPKSSKECRQPYQNPVDDHARADPDEGSGML